MYTSIVSDVWGVTMQKCRDANRHGMISHRKHLKTLEVFDPRERCMFSECMNVWTNELDAGTLYVSIQR